MVELEDILEREKSKNAFYDSLMHAFSFAVGAIFLVISLSIGLVLIYWLLSPQSKAITSERYIVELDEFVEALESAERYEIYDMRSERDYSAGHIPGVEMTRTDRCFTYGIDVCSRATSCDSSSTAFFYSIKGEEYHEVNYAVMINKTSCWPEVYMLDGGFNVWRDAGFDIEY